MRRRKFIARTILSPCIEHVDINKEDEDFVWVGDKRVQKVGAFYAMFDTFEEAKEWLKETYAGRVSAAESAMREYEETLKRVIGMEELASKPANARYL